MTLRVLQVFFIAVIGSTYSELFDLSCEQIRQFVDGHNSRREQLVKGSVSGQPAASEMNYMVWDEELADKASYWASELRQQHNPDTTLGSGRFNTGENLYWYYTTDFDYELNPDSALESWFKEHNDYTYGVMKSSDFGGPKDVGHYTQMAWSDSTYVGCAISQWSVDGWNKFFVVCNYGPPGNYMGQTPYPSGEAGGELQCGIDDCSQLYGDSC